MNPTFPPVAPGFVLTAEHVADNLDNAVSSLAKEHLDVAPQTLGAAEENLRELAREAGEDVLTRMDFTLIADTVGNAAALAAGGNVAGALFMIAEGRTRLAKYVVRVSL